MIDDDEKLLKEGSQKEIDWGGSGNRSENNKVYPFMRSMLTEGSWIHNTCTWLGKSTRMSTSYPVLTCESLCEKAIRHFNVFFTIRCCGWGHLILSTAVSTSSLQSAVGSPFIKWLLGNRVRWATNRCVLSTAVLTVSERHSGKAECAGLRHRT